MNLFTKPGKDDVTSMRIWHSRESPLAAHWLQAFGNAWANNESEPNRKQAGIFYVGLFFCELYLSEEAVARRQKSKKNVYI